MNLPCKVVEDLLPMYLDCLCSDETAALVKEHLKSCSSCSHMLVQLKTEFKTAEDTVDDIRPLTALREKWQKSKWSNIKKGICITLATLLTVAAVLTGTWYFRYGKIFYNMAENMEPTEEGVAAFFDSDYKKEVNGCRFDLRLPYMFGDNGYARVMGEPGVGVFIYPKGEDNYSWKLYITDDEDRSWLIYLKADLTPDFENYNTLLSAHKEKEKVRYLVEEKKEAISTLLEAVKVVWDIDLLEHVH